MACYPALYLAALVLGALPHPGYQGSSNQLVMGQEWPIDINAPPISDAVILGLDDLGQHWIIQKTNNLLLPVPGIKQPGILARNYIAPIALLMQGARYASAVSIVAESAELSADCIVDGVAPAWQLVVALRF